MTVRDFASKYGIPLNQMKAAMRFPQGGVRTCRELNAKMHLDYTEEEMLVAVTEYYLTDMRFCIERANRDNEMLKNMAAVCEVEKDGESQHS